MSGDDEKRPLGSPVENAPLRPVVELTPEWATAVASEFLDVVASEERQGLHPAQVDECWVAEDLAIYVRYRVGIDREFKRGTRYPDSHIDPTSAGYARDPREQGFYWLHNIEAASPAQWVDRLGYGWFGHESPPQGSWRYAVEELPRIVTLREPRTTGGEE